MRVAAGIIAALYLGGLIGFYLGMGARETVLCSG